ncbi:GIY-YIG nuclease family protein [Motilimonas sp. 1_MG-2023]|uniref:GIY-YIG nuclease family protein n=1 Tax=Motilimonas sp. 1_MG-2023 TaxID=3062672 RepID=UPI0026E41698|nr:GIY-YIG nuclease family protein [Motilimonas sp. 1_MG-2023]MDO6524720.1 GIY-YIG nuclease family protein [Motilimonas sp. 1_MG-2023]
MIYFIQGEITKKIKIGHTDNIILEDRLQPIRSSSPDKIMFLGGMPGDRSLESTLKKRFNKFNSHGEWFFENNDLYSFISNNCIFNEDILSIVIEEINQGNIDYKVAKSLGESDIKEIQRKIINTALNNIWETVSIPIE